MKGGSIEPPNFDDSFCKMTDATETDASMKGGSIEPPNLTQHVDEKAAAR